MQKYINKLSKLQTAASKTGDKEAEVEAAAAAKELDDLVTTRVSLEAIDSQ